MLTVMYLIHLFYVLQFDDSILNIAILNFLHPQQESKQNKLIWMSCVWIKEADVDDQCMDKKAIMYTSLVSIHKHRH